MAWSRLDAAEPDPEAKVEGPVRGMESTLTVCITHQYMSTTVGQRERERERGRPRVESITVSILFNVL